tara:strand:- start:1282 stop:1539 length:258 start_codon:yes stop_codon:yes gene_type:complete
MNEDKKQLNALLDAVCAGIELATEEEEQLTIALQTPEVQESTQKIEGEPPVREYAYGKEIVRDSDGSAVIGWYDDNDGNDIRCRD